MTITDKLTTHKECKLHWIIINTLLYGILSYVFYYFISALFHWPEKKAFIYNIKFFEYLIKSSDNINLSIVFKTSALAIVMAIILTYLINWRVFYKVANLLRLSGKIGDIWTYALEKQTWIVVRDTEDDKIYEGWLNSYSEGWEKTELFLLDVKIYENSTAKFIRSSKGVFINKEKEKLILEFPGLEYKDYKYNILEGDGNVTKSKRKK